MSVVWGVAIGAAMLALRHAISLHSYSGMGRPPLFGDYEAQRHWMEVTMNLPVHQWYVDGPDNDLQYWGLDYPPLTAYHSLLMGKLALYAHPDTVKLHSSRGLETPESKRFLRNTVLISDALVMMTAVFAFVHALYAKRSPGAKHSAAAFILSLPALVLIDHGHFQYNCVSLGLAIWAVVAFSYGSTALSACLFTMSFCYKQMSLYYAPAFFFVMLSRAIHRPTWSKCIQDVAIKGLVSIATLAVCVAPIALLSPSPISALLQIVHRVFPFARGLYEDKVANFWCTSNLVYKWSLRHTREHLVRSCLATTLLSLIPNGIIVLRARRPDARLLIYAMATSALSFFMFSFQVHEKSILLPVVPAALLCLHDPVLSAWFSRAALFSVYPLLRKDGLTMPYVACFVIGELFAALLPVGDKSRRRQTWMLWGSRLSLLGAALIHAAFMVVTVPPKYPDLFDVVVAAYSFGHFALFWVILLYDQHCLVREQASHYKSE
ncbi:Alpha-1,3-glucosyltransferase [Plasmodiophora brassicae]|nr:hypothetical protein PBRA_006145 [Plasmodiophora brassicae]